MHLFCVNVVGQLSVWHNYIATKAIDNLDNNFQAYWRLIFCLHSRLLNRDRHALLNYFFQNIKKRINQITKNSRYVNLIKLVEYELVSNCYNIATLYLPFCFVYLSLKVIVQIVWNIPMASSQTAMDLMELDLKTVPFYFLHNFL